MNRPPLVLHVIYRFDVGGLENGLVNLLDHMPVGRYRHAIACLAGFSQAFRARLRRDDVEVISLDKKPGKDIGAYWRFAKLLRRLRPAVVHTRNLGTLDLQWVALMSGVQARVHGEHGWEAADPKGRNPRNLRIRRACRPVVQRYVAVSRDIAGWLESSVRVPAPLIRQIYNGVDLARFHLDAPRPADFPWAAETKIIGTVGRLDPVKNHRGLLRAFAALCAESSPWSSRLRLAIIGDGPQRAALEAQAAVLGVADRVWFAGARHDVPALMRCLDVFVLPSLNEGISNTILEAMAMGLPVVAGDVGGNPELVDGTTGALYQGSPDKALPAALRPFLDDPERCATAGKAGRARIESRFKLSSMVEGYLAVYDELICAE